MAEHLRLALNQFTVRDLPFYDAVRLARDAGFTGLGVLRGCLDELGAGAVGALLARYGIEPTSVCIANGLVHADGARRQALFDDAVAGLRAATSLGVPLVVVTGGAGVDLPLPVAREQAEEAVVRLAERAVGMGGAILLEPLNPVYVSASAICSLRDATRLAATAPGCATVLDTWHVWAEEGLSDTLSACASSLPIVHLADWSADPGTVLDRELPGDGIAGLPALCGHLRAHGFAGWWEVEVLSERLWRGDQTDLPRRCAEAARQVLRHLREPSAAAASP